MSPSSADSFKSLIKDIAAHKAITLLTDSMLGRAMLKKLVAHAGRKLNIPLSAEPCTDPPGFWLLQAGEPGADLHLQCRIRTETLSEIAELAAESWLEDKKLEKEQIRAIIVQATNSTSLTARSSV